MTFVSPANDADDARSRPRLHDALAARFSPLAFDPAHRLTEADEEVLLEAARWAPSAGNSQPWMFHFLRRGTLGHDGLVARLAPSSARWAPSASALVVNLAHRTVQGTDWEFSEFADYDLGQAVAHMTIQAAAMGLSCRQFRAFDLDGLAEDLRVPEGWAVVSMTAIGRALDNGSLRERRSVGDLRLPHPDQARPNDRPQAGLA
jgi:nitroreductase